MEIQIIMDLLKNETGGLEARLEARAPA